MKTLFYTVLCLIPFLGSAQKQGNIWYFGEKAGLDFNSGNPVVLEDGQTAQVNCPACHAEGTATIADHEGNLLFYTDGQTVWNRNHQMMLNGDSLKSNISSTQSSIIIPKPGSSRYFYIFTTDDYYFNQLTNGFRYSVVDMCLDGGMGGIINDEKNKILNNRVCEKLTAVRHANGTDYWVIVHKFDSDAFHSYHLTASGISDSVTSHVGSVHTSSPSTGGAIGQLKASPSGEKLAIVNGNVTPSIAEYLDFDKSTGVVSNAVSIQTNPLWGYYGVSFSPDNSKLYLACTMNGNGIYQFDLSAGAGNPADVLASMTKVAEYYNYLGLQLANNGKIYVARSPFGFNPYLGVINDPNNAGVACNYVDSAVNLNGHSASYGFPNFVDSYSYSNQNSDCETSGLNPVDHENAVQVYPNPFTDELRIIDSGNEELSLTLYNLFGQKIVEQTGTAQITVKTTALPDGVYYYELKVKNQVKASGSLIKQEAK